MSRETISIESNGEYLIGIHDDFNGRDVCVVMLSAGLQNRCGARRFYWRVANALRNNFGVLRVDLSGAGDTTSEARAYHFDLHDTAEVSRVIDYAKITLGYQYVVLLSLCAGARVALKMVSLRDDIEATIALNPPVVTGGPQMPVSPLEPNNRLGNSRSKGAVRSLLRFLYTARFLQVEWWRNRMKPDRSFSADAARYLKSIGYVLSGKHKKAEKNKFVDIVRKLRKDHKVLFLYGEFDRQPLSEFREEFPELDSDGGMQSYQLIERGDHVFSAISAQEHVISAIKDWLEKLFPNRQQEMAQ